MKLCIKNLFILPLLITVLGFTPACRVTAQTFTTLHSFPFPPSGSEGDSPYAGVILSDNTLYGTTVSGGSSDAGTVFAMNRNGTGLTNLHIFTATSGPDTNSDGAFPIAGLILSGKTLYGTAEAGGSSAAGIVFAVNTDGSGFTNLHTFAGVSDGVYPRGTLILSDQTLYGTAIFGGSAGNGVVFKVNTDGTSFTNLHSFTAAVSGPSGLLTNSDGARPYGGLILSGDTLYGTTANGGSSGIGTVFKVNTNGEGFTTLHSFLGSPDDGGASWAGLHLTGNTLYGTARYGGSAGNGVVFKVNTDGTGFTNLHSFTGLNNSVNSDGASPIGGLISSGHTLYGTATTGGSSGRGTVFQVNTDGTGFTLLHSFTGYLSDGSSPICSLILSGNALYGTTGGGGSSGAGTVFSLFIQPQLTILPSGPYVILTWPTNATGFTLQSTTNLAASAVWTTNSPAPVVVNGQNTVTNPVSGAQQFFRLSQ